MTTAKQRYRTFHGAEPTRWYDGTIETPVRVSSLGKIDTVGYAVMDSNSSKNGRYVHDHRSNVFVYKAQKNGTRDIPIPQELVVLGWWLGMTYYELGKNGAKKEIVGSRNYLLCTNGPGTRLYVIHKSTKKVRFIIFGGRMVVSDWIKN